MLMLRIRNVDFGESTLFIHTKGIS